MNTHLKHLSKPFLPIALIIIILSLACGRGQGGFQNPQAGQPASQNGLVLFWDDFQDGQPDRWSINSAWYVEQSGDVYVFAASDLGAAFVTRGGRWTNYMLQADYRITSGNLVVSVNLTNMGRYGVRMGSDGVYLMKEQPPGNYTVLAQAGPVTAGEWHQVVFASQNGHLQVSIDQTLWFDFVDTAPLTQGSIAVSALSGSRVEVDNVRVSKIQGTLTTGVPQAPPPAANAPSPEQVIQQEAGSLPIAEIQIEEEAEAEEAPAPPAAGGQPDLVFTDVHFEPDPVVSGQPFTVNFLIQNQGNAPAGAFTVRFHFHAATGLADCNWDFDSVQPGGSVWGLCTRTTTSQPGNSPTRATIDVEGEVNESDENNNESTPTLTVTAAGGGGNQALPDLVVTDVTFVPDPAILGQQFVVNYMVANQGNGPAEIFTFRLHFNEETGLADCNMDVNGLAPGQSAWGSCTRTVNTHAGNFGVKATVDVEDEIIESNNANNVSSYTLTVGPAQQAALPDLIVTDVRFIAADTVQCNIRNIGTADAPAGVIVGVFFNGQPGGTQTIGGPIPVGTTKTRQFSGLVVPWPINTTCVADDPNAIEELIETNNELTMNIGP